MCLRLDTDTCDWEDVHRGGNSINGGSALRRRYVKTRPEGDKKGLILVLL